MTSEIKREFLSTLETPENSRGLRDIYDILIEYLFDSGCFLGRDGRRCMFEAYGTVVQFECVAAALADLSPAQKAQAVAALRYNPFTPLALVIASFIEGQEHRKQRETAQ